MDQATRTAKVRVKEIHWKSALVKLGVFASLLAVVVLLIALFVEAYEYSDGKGVFCEFLAILAFSRLLASAVDLGKISKTKADGAGDWKHRFAEFRQTLRPPSKSGWFFFLFVSGVFLSMFPFFIFFKAIGFVPGLIFIVIFSYLSVTLKGEHGLEGLLAILVLILFMWIWGEAGKPGLVVMPVDLPDGREDMEFTSEGVANALETEIESFGLKDNSNNFGQTEASRILAFDLHAQLFPETAWYIFPENPWYKGSDSRPSSLAGLYASHLVVGTQLEGFPLSSIYHVLRHLRGKPLLEGQILVGGDKSLTLALRQFNYPLNCVGEGLPRNFLNEPPKSTERGAVVELWERANGRDRLPRVPDTLGCFPGRFRRILHWLDLAELPVGGEERIANVTIGGDLKGDARLTAALQLAAIQSMDRLSAERMALYYDNAGVYRSAPAYFWKSLPELLSEAFKSPPEFEEFSRQKLANALIRIGDFENDDDCVEVKPCNSDDTTRHVAYLTANRILPNDLSVQARIGYGFLVNARQLNWTGKDRCVAQQKCVNQQQLLASAISSLEAAVASHDSDEGRAIRRYGLQRTQTTLAWAYANLAYARALHHGSSDGFNDALQAAQGSLKADEKDLRASIIKAYVLAMQGNCREAMQKLEEKGSRSSENYTLHNNILMEEQLYQVYAKCAEPYNALRHQVMLKSLISLTYFQRNLPAAKPLESLETLINNNSSSLPASLGPGMLFRRVFNQHSVPTSKPDDTEGQASRLCSKDLFAKLAPEDRWKARSLCARIEAMGCTHLQDGSALAETKGASESNPDDPYLMANVGIVYLKAGDASSALPYFRAAIAMDPRDPQLRYLLGYALESSKSVVDGKREMSYGKLLDPEGWQQIAAYYHTNSIGACVSRPSSSGTAVSTGGTTQADGSAESDRAGEPDSATTHQHPKRKKKVNRA